MKILSDLFAVFLFFITYIITKDMIAATTVAVIVGIAQAALTFWKHRKLDTMQWVSLILIVFFGGATILLKDNRFIMWKPTVLFWIGAIVMLFSHLAGKNGLKAVMGKEMQLPDFVWTRLTYAWIGFLIFMGAANLFVFTYFPDQWVNYKLFGTLGFTIIFSIAQSMYLMRFQSKEDQ